MKISGSHHLAVPRQRVWDALQDPAVLARTLPGCRSLEVTGPDQYAAVVDAGVGSIQGTYKGRVRLTDQDEPSTYHLTAEGAGTPGTIRAEATVRLEEADNGTTLHYDADAAVGGMIGGVGQRMIAGVANRTAGEFFTAVERELSGVPVAAPAGDAAGTERAGDAEIGRVYAGTPVQPSGRRTADRLIAAVAGAVLALLGVLVGRRLGSRK